MSNERKSKKEILDEKVENLDFVILEQIVPTEKGYKISIKGVNLLLRCSPDTVIRREKGGYFTRLSHIPGRKIYYDLEDIFAFAGNNSF